MADAKGIRAGSAYVELLADDSALQKGLRSAEQQVKSFGMSVGKIGAAIGGIGALITAPLIEATKLFAESGSELAHMSERTGMSVEALSVLSYAAKQSGTDLESVEVAVKRLQKAMTAGSLENVQAAQTFANLGLNVQQLMKLKPDQQFDIVAKRLAAVQNPAARAGASMMLFGRSGTALLPLIDHLGELSKEAEAFGLVSSTEAAEGALKLEHSMKLLDSITKKIITTVGSALAPSFERWNEMLAQVEKQVLDLVKANKPLIVMISTVGFAAVAAGAGIVLLGTVIFNMGQIIGVVSGLISTLYGAVTFLLSPMGLLLVAVAGATAAFLIYTDTGQQLVAFFKGGFNDMLATAVQTFQGIANAIKAGDIDLAVKILWAGIKVEWLKGSQFVATIWDNIKTTGIEAFQSLNTGIAMVLTDLWAAMQAGAVKAAFAMSDAIQGVLPNIAIGFARLKEMIGVGTHEATQAAIEARDKGVAESQAGKEETLGGIEQQRQGAQDVLQADAQARIDAAKKAADEKVAGANKELAAAQEELNRLTTNARVLALGADEKAVIPKAAGAGGEPMTPEGLDKGLGEGAKKAAVDVVGTFSGAAAGGLGVGQSIEKEHLEESKKQTKELEKIKKNTDARQVFAT